MKKVLFTMAMFSMVAVFAACGGGDKEDFEAQAKELAKQKCQCGQDDYKCQGDIDRKFDELLTKAGDENFDKLVKVYKSTYSECEQ